jgi:excisionase family DNA binding protein
VADGETKERGRREEFLTARQLAEFLQVSETTVRRLAREGRIPVVRLTPRLARYNLQAVLRALDGDGQRRPRRQQQTPRQADDPQLPFDDLK